MASHLRDGQVQGSIEAVGTACNRYHSGLNTAASRRRDGGAHGEHRGSSYCLSSLRQGIVHCCITPLGRRRARRASRQFALPDIATTAGRASLHRAAGTAARARRASGQSVLPVLTTTVGRASLHRVAGTAARTESIEAGGTACHRYESGLYIMASRCRDGCAHGEHRGSRYCL